jgi:hypothetical protein
MRYVREGQLIAIRQTLSHGSQRRGGAGLLLSAIGMAAWSSFLLHCHL